MKRMIDDKITNKLSIENDVLEIDGAINAIKITGDEIIENMSGYTAEKAITATWDIENVYTGIVKNGNKLTIVSALNIIALQNAPDNEFGVLKVILPAAIMDKLYPSIIGGAELLYKSDIVLTKSTFYTNRNLFQVYSQKASTYITFALVGDASSFVEGDKFYCRIECTFLLSDNIIS